MITRGSESQDVSLGPSLPLSLGNSLEMYFPGWVCGEPVDYLPSMEGALGLIPIITQKSGTVRHYYNPSSQQVDAGGSRVQPSLATWSSWATGELVLEEEKNISMLLDPPPGEPCCTFLSSADLWVSTQV